MGGVLRSLLFLLLEIYLWGIMFPRALLSWLPVSAGSPLEKVNHVLYRLTEPLLAPVRRLVPPVSLGGAGLDVSFLIVFFGLQILGPLIITRL